MNKKYEEIVTSCKPKEPKLKYYITAFLCGGIVGLLGEILITIYTYFFSLSRTDAGTYMIVTFIFIASLFTALGFFDKLVTKFRSGLLIPITGFAHSMTSSALDYKHEGPIFGVGSNCFRLAGSVIFYGVSSAWLFGLIRYLWEVLI